MEMRRPENVKMGTDDDRVVGFLHQKFRDFYAALFMRDELRPFGRLLVPEESDAWAERAVSGEVLICSPFWWTMAFSNPCGMR